VAACRYADSIDCDFIVDRHARYKSLLLATGDSGHAFKVRALPNIAASEGTADLHEQFLPVMRDLMVQAIEGTLAPHLQHAWSYTRPRKEKKEDRGDSVLLPLNLDSLAKGQDLLP
jgi:sarcosine oxidase/L-pipecolate oxidase